MRRRLILFSAVVCLLTLVIGVGPTSAANYGQLRPLNRRAATIARQKNSFVGQVLRSYDISYQTTPEGIVARLQIEDRWFEVGHIEIVPVLADGKNGLQVVAHEIFFHTGGNVLHLLSALTIR